MDGGSLARAESLTSRLRPAERLFVRCALVAIAVTIAAGAANALVGLGGATVADVISGWGSSVVYVTAAAVVVLRAIRIPQARGPWILLAAGLTLYAAGNVVWGIWLNDLEAPPIPSVSDALWLALYPASYVGLVGLARDRDSRVPAGVWLDGIVAGLGIAAIGAAVVFGPVLRSATGSTVAVATNLAYPVADLLLAALVMGVLALRGWRLDRLWGLLGGGFLLLCVADCMYLLRVAEGAVQVSLVPNVFYLTGMALLAAAAWQPQRRVPVARIERWSMLLVPATFVLAAMGLVLYDHFVSIDPLAFALAFLTLIAAMLRAALTFRDVRALAETRLEASTDDLTSLPNRRLFLRRVGEAIDSARRDDTTVALLLIDLDEFKKLNDTLGHHAGDALLVQIGPRVEGVLRSQDLLARLGGDEFGVLLCAPCDERSALHVADRIGDALRVPFEVEGLHLHVAASIGIALYPSHSVDAQQLLRHADVAMYQAKIARSGRECYSSDRDTHSRDSLALASDLPAAIAAGELEVHFQPKAEAGSRRIVGMEALVRWHHPERGLLPPADFISIAEQAGLMRDLTRAVMRQALAARRDWLAAGYDLHVAVNASVADLLDSQFPVEVADVLHEFDAGPGTLIVEVTESSIMYDQSRIGDVLARLSEFGVGISLDDFGTGYSSLMHLRSLPVSEVKIDRSFVARMTADWTDAAIVRSTIQLARNLGMRVVAEGVEDDLTWDALVEERCELVQGYRLSRPLAPDAVGEFLDGHAAGVRRATRVRRA